MGSQKDREDLPNLRKKPSYGTLSQALENLSLTHNSRSERDEDSEPYDSKEVLQFLNSIVSSDLAWLKTSDDENEPNDQTGEIWELACKRIAERCGRSAMGEMTREWVIAASATHPELKFSIREPALTGDNLGLKTWGTAYAICKILGQIGSRYFKQSINPPRNTFTTATGSMIKAQPNAVLELGAGTGLVGIAIAAIWKVDVVLTDLPEIQDNLHHNIANNLEIIQKVGGSAVGRILDWRNEDCIELGDRQFEIVVAADPLYDDEHPTLVATMIRKYLKKGRTPAAFIAVPFRDNNTKRLYGAFVNAMREKGLQLEAQGDVWFFDDDWQGGRENGVQCWWSIWRRNFPWNC